MNHQEGLAFLDSILPIVVGVTLGGLAFIGIKEFWYEFSVACKGGSQ